MLAVDTDAVLTSGLLSALPGFACHQKESGGTDMVLRFCLLSSLAGSGEHEQKSYTLGDCTQLQVPKFCLSVCAQSDVHQQRPDVIGAAVDFALLQGPA